MNPIKALSSSLLAIALASCASHRADPYDTGNVYGYPDSSYVGPTENTSSTLYDTPAVYDENTDESTAAVNPAPETPAVVAPEPAASNSYYRTHTVASGETLSSISAKYKVKMAAIIAANNIKNPNIVTVGTKLNIPSR